MFNTPHVLLLWVKGHILPQLCSRKFVMDFWIDSRNLGWPAFHVPVYNTEAGLYVKCSDAFPFLDYKSFAKTGMKPLEKRLQGLFCTPIFHRQSQRKTLISLEAFFSLLFSPKNDESDSNKEARQRLRKFFVSRCGQQLIPHSGYFVKVS